MSIHPFSKISNRYPYLNDYYISVLILPLVFEHNEDCPLNLYSNISIDNISEIIYQVPADAEFSFPSPGESIYPVILSKLPEEIAKFYPNKPTKCLKCDGTEQYKILKFQLHHKIEDSNIFKARLSANPQKIVSAIIIDMVEEYNSFIEEPELLQDKRDLERYKYLDAFLTKMSSVKRENE